MKLKAGTVLGVSLLLIGGFAVFDHFQDKRKAERKFMDARIMTVDFDKVDTLEITHGEKRIVSQRTTEGWNLIEPVQDSGDNLYTEDFIKNIYPESIIDIAAEGEKVDWALYGLDKPQGTILLKTADGKQNFFEVSEKTNFEDNVFIRKDKENRVLVVNSIWKNRINKPAVEFRDRRFLRHKIASVDNVRLKNENGLLEIKRVDGLWQFGHKTDTKIDQNKVRTLLTTIAEAKASDYPDITKKPALKNIFTIDLLLDGKKWNAQVGQTKDFGIFATVSEPAFFMKMEAGALDKLIKMTEKDLQVDPPVKDKVKTTDESTAVPEQKEKL